MKENVRINTKELKQVVNSILTKKGNVDTIYNDNIKKLCHIPDDEQIILEMAIGNYKDGFFVPVSHRRNVKDIIHYKS